MNTLTITMDQISSWKAPCYSADITSTNSNCNCTYRRWLEEKIAAGQDEIPVIDVLRNNDLSMTHRVWVGSHAIPEIRWWYADRAIRTHSPKACDFADLGECARYMRALPEIVDKDTAQGGQACASAMYFEMLKYNKRELEEVIQSAMTTIGRAIYVAASAIEGNTYSAAIDACNSAYFNNRYDTIQDEQRLQLERLIYMVTMVKS